MTNDRTAIAPAPTLAPVDHTQPHEHDGCCGHDHHHGHSHAHPAPLVRQGAKIGRNDACPCGSGKKYKKCCLDHAHG